MKEVYRPIESTEFPGYYLIPGFSGYAVSEYGEVKVIAKTGNRERELRIGSKIGDIKKTTNSRGYLTTSCRNDDDNQGSIAIHRLTCLAFYGPPVGDHNVVNHKDGNTLNNHYTNLEWCTPSHNTRHSFDAGLRSDNKPIKVWDFINNVFSEHNSFKDFGRSIGKSDYDDGGFGNVIDRNKKPIYLNRYYMKYGNDNSPWPTIEEVKKDWIIVKNLKTNEETLVLSMAEAAKVMGIKYTTISIAFKYGRQHFSDYFLAKRFSDDSPWLTIDEYHSSMSGFNKTVVYINKETGKKIVSNQMQLLANEIGVTYLTIYKCLRRKGKLSDGSTVMYLEDYAKELKES